MNTLQIPRVPVLGGVVIEFSRQLGQGPPQSDSQSDRGQRLMSPPSRRGAAAAPVSVSSFILKVQIVFRLYPT